MSGEFRFTNKQKESILLKCIGCVPILSRQNSDKAISIIEEIISGDLRYDFNRKICNDDGKIEDGFGGVWSVVCYDCKQNTMQVVRHGKVQCSECG